MTVRELVGGEVVVVHPGQTMREAARQMKSKGVGSLAVEVEGRLRGIITERDVLNACVHPADLDSATVADWMTDYPDSFDPDMSVDDAATWMLAAGYRHLPVVENGKTLGVISIKDILWALTGPNSR